eukprot:TRINITY_DN2080_c0_g1_i1.p1 TRINITY_DN2080_c0_g1~~TRINITY_DN2080_c0_g1_i1.p1  ORF type:complete len:125 (-),score=38.06 TRINITY_DN2080_c0_g1_i1:76-450(-)
MKNMRKMQIKRNSQRMGLNYKINNRSFLMENDLIFNLRKIDSEGLSTLLESKGFNNVAQAFKREMVDGMSFIIIFTEEEGLDMLQDDFNLNEEEITQLKELYCFIYRLRSMMCKNFKRDEVPCF